MNPLRLAFATLFILLFPAGIALADGTLYVSPDNGTYSIGDTFQVQVMADSGGQPINAAEADITFDPDAVDVESISTDGSILSSWPTPPEFSNTDGTIDFSGVASTDYTGGAGLLVTVTFKALANLETPAHFESGALLAADGIESNIITSLHSGLYVIEPVDISAPPPDGSSDASSSADGSGGSETSDGAEANDTDASTSESAAPSDVAPPVLENYQTEISVGNRIVVQGSAPPDSTVSIWLQEGSGQPQRTDMESDDKGSFTFVSDTEAEEGVYSLWAATQGPDGKDSVLSNKIDITAIPSGAASVALFESSISSNIIPFFALLIFAGLGTGYLFHKHKLEKLKIERLGQNPSA